MGVDVRFAYGREWDKEPLKTAVLHLTVPATVAAAKEVEEPNVDFGDALERSFSGTIGQPFAVRLKGCHACGYTWQVLGGTQGLQIQGPTKVASQDHKKGGDELVKFKLVASEVMSVDVRFAYGREWEKEPLNTAVLHLAVPAMTVLV